MKSISKIAQRNALVMSNQMIIVRLNTTITRTLSTSNHWSFSPSYPSKTVSINPKDKINDDTCKKVMASKLDCDKEKLSFCYRSNQLKDLFNHVSIKRLDNVLQKNIVKQANDASKSNVDEWMLFNYEKHQNQKSWMLKNADGYDANGIIIAGLSSLNNEIYSIGPIILEKQYL